MPKYLIVSLMLTFLLGSCASGSPAPLPTAAATPTITPSPASSATPTLTSYSTLQTQGPYVLFARGNNNLTLLDADGSGQKQLQLPNTGYVQDVKKAISPDGKWLVYFTGSKDEEPFDLALHLFDLENETTFQIARLIAPAFPENLEPVKAWDPAGFIDCDDPAACRIGALQRAFAEGIGSLSWSPDSQELAFAAQIDGPSSDVYIFKLADHSIRRLVSDLENVWQIDWAPNGERILYQNSTAGPVYTETYIYIADPTVTTIQSPNAVDGGTFWYEYGWINESLYLISSGGEGASPHHFRYIDVETGQVKEVWPYTAEYVAIEQSSEALVLSTVPGEPVVNEPEEGTYLVHLNGNLSKITDDPFVLYEGFRESQVFGWRENQIYSILLDGTVALIGTNHAWNEYQPPQASPDHKWILLREHPMKMSLYDGDTYEQVKTWDMKEYIYTVSWRPDSLGVFVSAEDSIYYLAMPNGKPIRLQDCSPSQHCGLTDFVWLP